MSILTRTIIMISFLLAPFAPLASSRAAAGEKEFRLAAPERLVQSGFLKFLLPRFSLKTQVRIKLVAQGGKADAALGATGKAVFAGLDQTWRLLVHDPNHPGVQRFAAWIESEVGQRTVTSFTIADTQPFTLPATELVQPVKLALDGDPVAGREIAQAACGRCHVVSKGGRMNAIGSTPSFFVLRSLPDWTERFEAFYALNPHPAFTQVEGVTPPFRPGLPSPIVPLEVTLDELEAIIAYVGELAPADLGAPLVHQ